MEFKETERGFTVSTFKDGNGEQCSIQESSACRDEGMLWLGIDDVEVKCFGPDGWQDVPMPTTGDVLKSGRMHLTQTMVKDLLPALTHFAERGCLPGREVEPGIGCPCCRQESE